ncbi:carbohydrate kinase family protein [Patescibacteria group bacterium]|nr:carbohydrate kinase family protein [Patescibacteria group bacterium]MBU4367780.1 carbohydrate kinase family protein [Patescibacteria group bacterium]MBU4461470.1 carbohydrate kinase family protein [Patescibacteria group bacterium]MCG2700398.1 carbohydrate kinase family protein [Candidatus Parcubacteria bacterium]
MYDIITFGSATKDIFIKTKKFRVLKDKKNFATGKGVCFNLGSKVDIDEILFASGGGGTNTAATFAKQGFRTAYCGAVGQDLAGQEIIEELKNLNINTQLVVKSERKPTNHSIVISGINDDRTILVYRGASEELKKENIPWLKLKTKWFYISPLSGELCKVFGDLIDFAVKNKIKVALNPGNCQLSLPPKLLRKNLGKIDVLILNQEEASLLTGISYKKEKEIFKKIDEICSGIVIMTKGEKGVVLSDGEYLYRALPPKMKAADRTGAGDSFGAGFVSGFLRSRGDIIVATQIGIANSTACLKKLGAKQGLLKKNEKFYKVEVKKEKCSKNGLCQCRVCG